MQIQIKRVYDEPATGDGLRVLVDRLWPRGKTKEAAAVDIWAKEIAPSNELRKWFHADTTRWAEFTKRYKAELKANQGAVDELVAEIKASRKKTVTLLFGSKETERNHAVVLKEMLRQ